MMNQLTNIHLETVSMDEKGECHPLLSILPSEENVFPVVFESLDGRKNRFFGYELALVFIQELDDPRLGQASAA